MFFDRGVCFVPTARTKRTNLFEMVCIMSGVPQCPKTIRVAFGPPIFDPNKILQWYGRATVGVPQETPVLFRILLLFAYPILCTFSFKLIPSADQRFVSNINDGIINNSDSVICIRSGIIISIDRWDNA